jgi:hypothetical protein
VSKNATGVIRAEVPRHRVVRGVLQQERRFYAVASFLLLLITVVGFRQFLLQGKGADGIPITPHILRLVVIHGLAMLAWVVLLFVQSLLIVAGRRRLHMTLGLLGAVLAGAIVILGTTTAVLSARYNPALYEDFGGARYFLTFALTAMLLFGALAAIGIAYRRRPDVHRPMLLLATVASMTGSFDRWPFIPWLMVVTHGNVPMFHWGPTLLLGAALLALHAAMTRQLSRWHATGYAGVLVVTILSTVVARSAAWNQLAALAVP